MIATLVTYIKWFEDVQSIEEPTSQINTVQFLACIHKRQIVRTSQRGWKWHEFHPKVPVVSTPETQQSQQLASAYDEKLWATKVIQIHVVDDRSTWYFLKVAGGKGYDIAEDKWGGTKYTPWCGYTYWYTRIYTHNYYIMLPYISYYITTHPRLRPPFPSEQHGIGGVSNHRSTHLTNQIVNPISHAPQLQLLITVHH